MKKVLAMMLALAMIFALAACGGSSAPAPAGNDQPSAGGELAGTYDILVWVGESAVDLTKKQIEDFNASNEFGITFNAEVNPVSEATAADQMLVDIDAGADLYCFPQDQFARLVQANALAKLGDAAKAFVIENNDPGVVAAATTGEEVYAYPLTSDNGYFMYYDKSVIPEEDIDSLEALIKDCEDAGKLFCFEAQSSAWYIASWFFATGCVSEWTTDDEGHFISVKDTFNSDNGLIAVKGMEKLLKSPCHKSSSAADEFANGAAIVVTGTWAYSDIEKVLGDNLGASDLPSFEVDGKEYHLGSFNGCKLMGVKPQSDPVKGAALHKLAQYLTGEACQMERFQALAWGPANLVDQQSPEVQANPGLAALLLQGAYSRPQGQIHGSWWDIAKVIGDDVKAAEDEAGLKAALQNYYDKISALFNMTEDELTAWSVIGAVCGTSWDTDFPMAALGGDVYASDPLELHAGEEFKVRQGASWDVNYGSDGTIGGPNVVVEADGTYIVRLSIVDGVGNIELVDVNGWGVIGAICGTMWDTDFPMAAVGDGVFESEALELHAGEEFKVRQGGGWDVNYGADGTIGGPNVVVEADGTYVVRLTIADGVGTIELIAQ